MLSGCDLDRETRCKPVRYRWDANEDFDQANSEIETRFWSSLGNGSPLYGADVEGSCFDEGVPWNLKEI